MDPLRRQPLVQLLLDDRALRWHALRLCLGEDGVVSWEAGDRRGSWSSLSREFISQAPSEDVAASMLEETPDQ